jgi:16S rRNA U1498 N3-methylase RsmE
MVAQKLDGTAVAKSVREKLNAQIKEKQEKNPRYKPSLVIIQGMLMDRTLEYWVVLTLYLSRGPIRLQ